MGSWLHTLGPPKRQRELQTLVTNKGVKGLLHSVHLRVFAVFVWMLRFLCGCRPTVLTTTDIG